MATAKAPRVPIPGVHSNRHAGMQNRKDPSQCEQQVAARQAQQEPSWSLLWVKITWRTKHGSDMRRQWPAMLGHVKAMASHAHGLEGAHGLRPGEWSKVVSGHLDVALDCCALGLRPLFSNTGPGFDFDPGRFCQDPGTSRTRHSHRSGSTFAKVQNSRNSSTESGGGSRRIFWRKGSAGAWGQGACREHLHTVSAFSGAGPRTL